MSVLSCVYISAEETITSLARQLRDLLQENQPVELLLLNELKQADAACLATLVSAAVAGGHTVRIIAVNLPVSPAMLHLLRCGSPGERLVLLNKVGQSLAQETTNQKNMADLIKKKYLDRIISTWPSPLS